MKRLLAALALGSGVMAVNAACQDTPFVQPCTNIPPGGCPLKGPAVCTDVTCQAVYKCNLDRTWTLDSVCPAREAGAPDAALPDATPPQHLRDAAIDVQGARGGPGCKDLQPPDCPLGTALACPSNACCGCEDLFVCADGGWSAWGTCSDGAVIAR